MKTSYINRIQLTDLIEFLNNIMQIKFPGLTDMQISRTSQVSLKRSQPHSRVLCLSQKRSSCIPSGIQIRENQLLWMFNRRKQKLIETSVQNLRLYNRIKSQKSNLSRLSKNKSKLNLTRISTEEDMYDKQNMQFISNQIKKKEQEISNLLRKSVPKQLKKYYHPIFKPK